MLTKEVRAELEAQLSQPWGIVKLQCDEDVITLNVQPKAALRYEIMMYVNGFFKGPWMHVQQPAPEQKYLRLVTKSMVKPAERKKAEKELGKRYVAKSEFWSATYSYYVPYWPSAKSALAHLMKCAKVITVIKRESSVEALPILVDADLSEVDHG